MIPVTISHFLPKHSSYTHAHAPSQVHVAVKDATHNSHTSLTGTGQSWRVILPVSISLASLMNFKRNQRCRPLRAEGTAADIVQAKLPYQADHVERSLKYVGVGSVDGVFVNSETVYQPVEIKNGRDRDWSLDVHGFKKVDHVSQVNDFYNEKTICCQYYPECEQLVKNVTGANKVFAFYHTVRSHMSVPGARQRKKQGFPVEDPAATVHVDYSSACSARVVRQFAKRPSEWQDPRPLLGPKPFMDISETDDYILGKKRWAIINVWRNLSSHPVQRTPVALAVGTSISLDDIITFQAKAGQWQSKEYYFASHSKAHDWYYFPEMKMDESILIKNWDSAGEAFAPKICTQTVPCTFAFHTAFEHPYTPPDAPFRESMEVRTVAFW